MIIINDVIFILGPDSFLKWSSHCVRQMEPPLERHPLPLHQILPSPTFLLDVTVESYNRDASLLPSKKKSHFEIPCAL
jgi:hypothetical protein